MTLKLLKKLKLVLFFALLSASIASAQTFSVGGVSYSVISSTNSTVGVISSGTYSGALVVPSSISNAGITYTVVSILDSAFENSTTLTSITIPNTVTEIRNGAFRYCTNLTYVSMGTAVISLGQLSFASCTNLTSVIIPNSVTSIGISAFASCTNLTSLTMGNSVVTIGGGAFSLCFSLTSVKIPNSVTSIGNTSFGGCTSLSSLTIGNSVTSIATNAFQNCSALTSVTVNWATPLSIIPSVFNGVNIGSVTLKVPAGTLAAYQTAAVWQNFITIVQPPAATYLNFDGVDDRVEVANESNFDFTTTFSMEAWIRVTSFTNDWQTVISKGPTGPRIHRYAGTNFIAFSTGGNDDLPSTVSVNDGAWHHIAATCNNGAKSLYVDGVLQGTQTVGVPLPLNNDNVRIGSQTSFYNPIRAFQGDIDDVRFWTVARTQTEINNSKNLELIGNETGLLAYFNFNQGVNASNNVDVTTAIDATGNNNGTVINFALIGTTSNWLSGTAATHLNFDGVNDYVTVNIGATNVPQNNYTNELWFKTINANGVLLASTGTALPNAGQHDRAIYLQNGNVKSYAYNGSQNFISSTATYNDGNWHHVAEVVTPSGRSLYVDSTLVGTDTAVSTQSLNYVTLGNCNLLPSVYFNGSIDEVRIWNVARTANQISASKNCEFKGNETGLVAYYKFNQGADAGKNFALTSLTDATSNLYNGILNNFTLLGSTSNWLAGSPITTGSILPSNASVTTPVVYNQGATATALTATTGTNGSGLMWYVSATGGIGTTTAPTPSTTTAGNTSYWVASSNANGCESARTEIIVTVNAAATHLNFDGVNDFVNCGNASSLQISGNQITLQAMIYPKSWRNQIFEGCVIVKEGTNSEGYFLRVGNNGSLNAAFGNGSQVYQTNINNILSLNVWQQITVTYDGSTIKTYVNGTLVGSDNFVFSVVSTTSNLLIGSAQGFSDRNFPGSIDEVRIWNRALTVAEILNNLNCELPTPTTQNGLVAYYQFNQGFNSVNNTAITTLTDASVNNNTGTLANFALTGTASNWLAGSPIVTGTTCSPFLSSSAFDIASKINLYPNPTSGIINFDANKLTNACVSVSDLNGRIIFSTVISANENTIDISNFQAGIYLIKIKAIEGEIVQKIIKN